MSPSISSRILPPYSSSLTVDRSGVVVNAGADAAQVLGCPDRATLVGFRLDDVLAPEAARLVGGYLAGECSHGAVFDVSGLQFVVRPGPAAELFTLHIEDIKARQVTLHRFQLTQTTVEHLTDMIIWLDPDGRYIYVNPAATALLGYSAEELSELRVVDVDPFFDEQRWRDHWQEIVERKSFTIETVNTTKSGVDVPIEVTVNYVEHDGAFYNCSIVRDISERKRFESRLLELNEEITRLSITDDLTGIGNRRHFDAQLAQQIDLHATSGVPLSVIMLDIDHFKAFNDHYGHTAGDHCLRSVAHAVARVTGEFGGTAARYGGEEFVCLLPSTDRATAQSAAERIQLSVVDLAIPHAASGAADVVTVSAGAFTAEGSLDAHAILTAVDGHLYQAKRKGRNRIIHGGTGPVGMSTASPKIDL